MAHLRDIHSYYLARPPEKIKVNYSQGIFLQAFFQFFENLSAQNLINVFLDLLT